MCAVLLTATPALFFALQKYIPVSDTLNVLNFNRDPQPRLKLKINIQVNI